MRWDDITKALAGALGAIAGLLGEWNVLLTILAIMMLLDYVTGLIVAWRGKSPKTETGGVSSKAGFDGLIRKAFIMVVVLMATLLDTAIGNASRVFQTAAVMYYIANEGISILENTALMGVQYPKYVIKALETMREKNDGLVDGAGANTAEAHTDAPATGGKALTKADNVLNNDDNVLTEVDNVLTKGENVIKTGENVIDLDSYIYHREDKPPGSPDDN